MIDPHVNRINKLISSLSMYRAYYDSYHNPWMKSFFGNLFDVFVNRAIAFLLQLIGLGFILWYGVLEYTKEEIHADPSLTDGEADEIIFTIRIAFPTIALVFIAFGRLIRGIRVRNAIITEFQQNTGKLVSTLDQQIRDLKDELNKGPDKYE